MYWAQFLWHTFLGSVLGNGDLRSRLYFSDECKADILGCQVALIDFEVILFLYQIHLRPVCRSIFPVQELLFLFLKPGYLLNHSYSMQSVNMFYFFQDI